MIGFGESLFVKKILHLFSETVPKTTVQWILIPLQKNICIYNRSNIMFDPFSLTEFSS